MNSTDVDVGSTRRRRTVGSVLLEFLGSMNLAITLLVVVAIASVVGTVLRQNEPYQNYIIKFGPFWFEVFKTLGLYDVYSAGWFLFILTFLVVSTSVCIYRHAPQMLRDMRSFRLNVQEKSLRAFHHRAEILSAQPAPVVAAAAEQYLTANGYRVRRQEQGGRVLVAAMRGAANRLGYLFAHAAIVIICVGGLVDGNVPLKFAELTGKIRAETRDIPVSQVPPISRLGAENRSFRGSISIPEGSRANVVFLRLRDGYLVQQLPFSVEVKDFRVDYYPTGQPKSFETDLVIHDEELDQPLERRIAVNHPLTYKGYSIYQSSFGDGGSRLELRAWPLDGSGQAAVELDGAVFEKLSVQTPAGPMTLEFTDFRMFNINPVEENGERTHRNFGPSFTFKLRNAAGEALEYVNYMTPVLQDGRLFYLSGMRGSPAEPYRYMYIPADPQGGLERFLRFNALIHDGEKVRAIADRTVREAMADVEGVDATMQQGIIDSMQRLVALFGQGGFEAIVEQTAGLPDDRRMELTSAYVKVLQNILGALYVEVLRTEGVDVGAGVSDADSQFFDDAVNALGTLKLYGSPFFLQLTGFQQVEASGLQITKAPGKNVVYLGFALLTVGVFLMFYVSHRRVWVWITPKDGETELLLAGTSNRDQLTFERDFAAIQTAFAARLTATGPGATEKIA